MYIYTRVCMCVCVYYLRDSFDFYFIWDVNLNYNKDSS